MAWVYSQSNGALSHYGLIGYGYSGFGSWKNNPAAGDVHGLGPIPRGLWKIGMDVNLSNLGPMVMPLVPNPETETFGRSGFFIHGDDKEHRGSGSSGCIVLARPIREQIAISADRVLEVV